MRREQKRQVQEFVELLSQAHEEIKKEIERKDPAAAMGLLAQCQEGAIQMGSLIEATEGEGAPTIALLESYCELVYGIYGELGRTMGEPPLEEPGRDGGQAVGGAAAAVRANAVMGGAKAYKKLRAALLRIEGSIRNDIKVRLEIAFLPYKERLAGGGGGSGL